MQPSDGADAQQHFSIHWSIWIRCANWDQLGSMLNLQSVQTTEVERVIVLPRPHSFFGFCSLQTASCAIPSSTFLVCACSCSVTPMCPSQWQTAGSDIWSGVLLLDTSPFHSNVPASSSNVEKVAENVTHFLARSLLCLAHGLDVEVSVCSHPNNHLDLDWL